jgi:hypothetical protein
MNKLYNSDFTVRCHRRNPGIPEENFTFPKTCLHAGRYTEMPGYGASIGRKVIFSNNECKINMLYNYMFVSSLFRCGEWKRKFHFEKKLGKDRMQQPGDWHTTASFFPMGSLQIITKKII